MVLCHAFLLLLQDSPVRFIRIVESSPKEALRRARGVIQMYLSLMTESISPVDWDCHAEYAAEEDSESTTVADTSTPGTNSNSYPA